VSLLNLIKNLRMSISLAYFIKLYLDGVDLFAFLLAGDLIDGVWSCGTCI